MRLTSAHSRRADADRIALYIEDRTRRYRVQAELTGRSDLLTRATTLDALTSDIRARLFEDWLMNNMGSMTMFDQADPLRGARQTARASVLAPDRGFRFASRRHDGEKRVSYRQKSLPVDKGLGGCSQRPPGQPVVQGQGRANRGHSGLR